MLARYKGGTSDVKEYRFKGKSFKFPKDEWTPVHDIRLFIELSRYSDVFDVVCFFDLKKLKRYAKEIYIDKDLIFTSSKSAARQIAKLPFIRLQATKPEKGQFIFQVLNYANSDLSNYERVSKKLSILIYRRLLFRQEKNE